MKMTKRSSLVSKDLNLPCVGPGKFKFTKVNISLGMSSLFLVCVIQLLSFEVAHSQESTSSPSVDELTFDPDAPAKTELEKEAEAAAQGNSEAPSDSKKQAPLSNLMGEIKQDEVVKDLSGLGQLSAFNDIAVIQRRFLPKTKRFEAFPSAGFIVNQAFFLNYMLGLKLAFSFTESWALEANSAFLGSAARDITKDLRDKRGIATSTFVDPKSYVGLDIKWSPIYGKMGLLNRKIVPFDMYYVLGGGKTNTSLGGANTIHAGLGQIYALGKSTALRWDLSWYVYSAPTDSSGAGGGTFTDMNLSFGMSFFFPGAKYR
jgi:outer membrane beta-barrel protein